MCTGIKLANLELPMFSLAPLLTFQVTRYWIVRVSFLLLAAG
jgi:hypothetical protein